MFSLAILCPTVWGVEPDVTHAYLLAWDHAAQLKQLDSCSLIHVP